jgi:hypothetical protein
MKPRVRRVHMWQTRSVDGTYIRRGAGVITRRHRRASYNCQRRRQTS